MRRISRWAAIVPVALMSLPRCAQGQAAPATPPAAIVARIPVNYDEGKVGTYALPDPLVMSDGRRVRDAKAWFAERRPEIVRLF